jgi:hypothetical protein
MASVMKKRMEQRKADWDSEWEKAYVAAREESLKGKKCRVAGCPCEGKKDASHYLKQKGLADLSKPSLSHSFGEVMWQIHSGGIPACDVSKAKKPSASYMKVADRQAKLLAEKYGIDEAAIRADLEAARNN